jgi:hypothetical protein
MYFAHRFVGTITALDSRELRHDILAIVAGRTRASGDQAMLLTGKTWFRASLAVIAAATAAGVQRDAR